MKTPQSLRDSSPTGAPVYRRQQYQTVRLCLVGRCALTPPLSFRQNKTRNTHRLHFRGGGTAKPCRRGSNRWHERAHRIKNEPLFSQRLKSFVLFKVSFEGFKFFFKNCGKSFAKLSIELFNALCLFVPKVFINIKNLLKRFK